MASGDTLCVWTAVAGTPPAANYATLDLRNNHPVLDFDATAVTDETASFEDILPANYAGGGITIDLYWMATTATTGDVKWGSAIERMNDNNTDFDADDFATEQVATTTTNGTSGKGTKTSITHSSGANMDSLAAGEPFRCKIARKSNDAADTMAGDAELYRVVVRET